VGLIIAYPVGRVIAHSLTDETTFLPGEFVGLDNYGELLGDPLFRDAFLNNLVLLISVPVTILAGLCITGVLYRGIRGAPIYEALVFIPFLPAVASIGVIFLYILGSSGPLNSLLRDAGAGGLAQPWLADSGIAIWTLLAVVVWKRVGFVVLLFTARMVSLDQTLFDAASVDGASWARTFWRVAVPQMKSIISFAAVLGFIEVFSWTFAYVFVLTGGGPAQATYTLEFLLYDLQFKQNLVGLASAVAVFLLAAALSVAGFRVYTARREGVL
jgi:ABC-type sugar transport system permease subunit